MFVTYSPKSLGLIFFGAAKRLTRRQPDGDLVVPLGEKYEIG